MGIAPVSGADEGLMRPHTRQHLHRFWIFKVIVASSGEHHLALQVFGTAWGARFCGSADIG
jgi:hypothetical protein